MTTATSGQAEKSLKGWQIGRLQPMPERVPHGWELVRLTSVATLESGHTPSRRFPEYWKGDIPWISLHDTDGLDVPEISTTAQTIGELGLANSSARILPKGTVVFSRTATVGKATVMGRAMATSQDFANYVCGPRVHNHYLMHLFRFLAPEWKRLMSGSTLNTIYMPVFREIQVLLPPVEEQRAIAAALSDVDALLGALDGLIAKKRDIKQAAMQHLLTGRTRLPGFRGTWETVRAGDVGRFRGGSGFPTNFQGATDGDYPFFKVSDMNHAENAILMIQSNNWISEKVRKILGATAFPAGSVVFAKVGAAVFLERKKLLVRPSCLDNNMAAYVVQEEQLTPGYAHLALLNTKLGDLVSTTALPSLNGAVLAQIPLQFPPIAEQRAIVAALSDMDAELTALEQRREKTRLLKQGMMQELLTGRTRLV